MLAPARPFPVTGLRKGFRARSLSPWRGGRFGCRYRDTTLEDVGPYLAVGACGTASLTRSVVTRVVLVVWGSGRREAGVAGRFARSGWWWGSGAGGRIGLDSRLARAIFRFGELGCLQVDQ